MGFGNDFVASDESLNFYSAFYSKGLGSASDKTAYKEKMNNVPKLWRHLFEYGERICCNPELAKEWLLNGQPKYDITYTYVLFKPLEKVTSDDNLRAVIFPVNPVELSGLSTLTCSVISGTDPVQLPQGSDCNRIASFAYAQADQSDPRAVLGMLSVEGREVMRKRFRDDILTFTLPAPLYHRVEQEAGDSILQTPSWKRLSGRE